jgi:Carboxypeptidase regulatory-like domain
MEVAAAKFMGSRNLFFRAFLLVAVLSAALGASALAQSTASLSGTITDATGAAVVNAKVAAINQATSVASGTQSDSAGAYLFPSLPIGKYRIEVTAVGFQKAFVADLDLPVATSVTQNIQLKVGEASATVEITADAVILDTTINSMG